MKSYVFDNWIGITVPDSWEVEKREGNPHLQVYSNDASGVILISFFRRTQNEGNLKDEVEKVTTRFMEQMGADVSQNMYRVFKKSKFRHFKREDDVCFTLLEYNDGENYWRVWHFLDKSRLTLVTYNCNILHKNEEREVVSKIIESIDFVD